MWKIEVSDLKLHKVFYENEADFIRWFDHRVKRFGRYCSVLGYKQIAIDPDEWELIRFHPNGYDYDTNTEVAPYKPPNAGNAPDPYPATPER